MSKLSAILGILFIIDMTLLVKTALEYADREVECQN
jgi:hypothetical protein